MNRSPSLSRTAITSPAEHVSALNPGSWTWLACVLAAFSWAYWATLDNLYREWQVNQDYSVGQLVPLVAAYLIWLTRANYRGVPWRPCWAGILVVVAAQFMRLRALTQLYESGERYALVLTLYGLVLLVAGLALTWKLRWVLAFLLLAIPLPGRVHNFIAGPLQDYSTAGAVFLLEIFGVTVSREGHVILLDDRVPLAVAEACSGLRMLTAFVVVAAAFAFMVKRPTWQRAVLVFSSIPIAIVCNLLRLLVTAALYLVTSSKTAESFFHDFAGITMMPLAVLILFGELWVMKWLEMPAEQAPAAK